MLLLKLVIVASYILCHYFHPVQSAWQFGACVGHWSWLLSAAILERPGGAAWLCMYLEGFLWSLKMFSDMPQSHTRLLCGISKQRGEGALKHFWVHLLGQSLKICPCACGSQQTAEVLIPSKNIYIYSSFFFRVYSPSWPYFLLR